MTIKKALVEIAHDEGYGDALLEHINNNLRGKDMLAVRIVTIQESAPPKDGGPAFQKRLFNDGVTLRDRFAMSATPHDVTRHAYLIEKASPTYRTVSAEEAKYAYADAMIAQRSKQTHAPST